MFNDYHNIGWHFVGCKQWKTVLVAGSSSFSSTSCHLCYFLIAVKSLQLCAISLAQIGLWNDKALQDVSSESALTPPIAFYGPEGEGALEATDSASVTNWVVCLWTHSCGWERECVGLCVCTSIEVGNSYFPPGFAWKHRPACLDLHALLCVNVNQQFSLMLLLFSPDDDGW